MTDEELLRKVAEIEGYDDYSQDEAGLRLEQYRWPREPLLWNPLTNKAQAFELVEKYCEAIEGSADGLWCVWVRSDEKDCADKGIDPSLPRAICLAIVEANS